MKKLLIFTFGAMLLLVGNFLLGSSVYAEEKADDRVLEVQPRIISGAMTIEKQKYKWMEASFGGLNRGYTINPGNLNYKLSPNPHDDPWYNKKQIKFYNTGANQIETQANAGSWHSKGWPNTINNIKINKIVYTLTKQ